MKFSCTTLLFPGLCAGLISGPYFFDQLSTHLDSAPPAGFNQTFKQRYWLETSFYARGGPVILVDAADKPGERAFPLVDTGGIVHHLLQATHGAAVILEQRYYGQSLVASNLSVDQLQLLNTDEALADTAYFASNFPYDNPQHASLAQLDASILPAHSPWIAYGFWIAGAKAAWMRTQYPDVIWGSIASSPALFAVENVWQYLEAIRLGADATCVRVITSAVDEIDAEIERAGLDPHDGETIITKRLAEWMDMFNLTAEKTARDFMNQVATPLGLWQRKSWYDGQEDYASWDAFCGNLTQGLSKLGELELRTDEDPRGPVRDTHFRNAAIKNYAEYIRQYKWIGHQSIPTLSATEDQAGALPGGFLAQGEIRRNRTESQKTDLAQTWRLWYWQACTEWGYFSTAEPAPMAAMLSRSLDLYYLTEVCRFAFDLAVGEPDTVPVQNINKYGGFNISAPRLFFVDGELDPWLYVTRHSSRTPFVADGNEEDDEGLLIAGAGFANDRFALPNLADEPPHIRAAHEREIEVVKQWTADWHAAPNAESEL